MGITTVARQQLEEHAPRLHDVLARRRWHARNRERLCEPPPLSGGAARLAGALQRNGVVVAPFEDLFGSRELLEDAAAEAVRLQAAAPAEGEDGKGFLTILHRGPYDLDHAFARIAFDERALGVAAGYLGMRAQLRSLQLWHTRPTPGAARETQLWHRDADDVMNVKLFVYFTDVTPESGPLCYAPGTHPGGRRRRKPERDEGQRSTDEQMERIVPRREWVLSTGPPGTIALAETSGYHKQLKPTSGERLALMIQYTSGTPNYPRDVEIRVPDGAQLSAAQRYALAS